MLFVMSCDYCRLGTHHRITRFTNIVDWTGSVELRTFPSSQKLHSLMQQSAQVHKSGDIYTFERLQSLMIPRGRQGASTNKEGCSYGNVRTLLSSCFNVVVEMFIWYLIYAASGSTKKRKLIQIVWLQKQIDLRQ